MYTKLKQFNFNRNKYRLSFLLFTICNFYTFRRLNVVPPEIRRSGKAVRQYGRMRAAMVSLTANLQLTITITL